MADEDEERLRANLARLRGSLSKARDDRGADRPERAPPAAQQGDSGMSLGLRAGSEFVSAVIVGLGIGWAIDKLFHTNPAFLILFFLLGVAAGVWNVIRVTSPKRPSSDRNSPLSRAESPDKDVRRPAAETGRNASLGGRRAPDGADDDED